MPLLIALRAATVGAQDTVLPVVLSAPAVVTRDKTRPRRYAKHDVQIRHDRRERHDRQGRSLSRLGLRPDILRPLVGTDAMGRDRRNGSGQSPNLRLQNKKSPGRGHNRGFSIFRHFVPEEHVLKTQDSNFKSPCLHKFQVRPRPRRACPGGALTDQLPQPLATLPAPVGLVPTERMTVGLALVAPVGTSPTESLKSTGHLCSCSVMAPPGQARRWPHLKFVSVKKSQISNADW